MDPNFPYAPGAMIKESFDSLPRKSPHGASARRQSIVSSCDTRMSTRRFTNFWTIEQFSVQQELHSFGEWLMASKFGDEEYEFALKLFPSGKDEETVGYLSLFLLINKCPNPRLRFRVSFTVETLDGPRNCALNKNLVTINRAGIVTASKFFSVDVLKSLSARYLPNDCLTIGVDLVVFGEAFNTATSEASIIGPPSSKIARTEKGEMEYSTENSGFMELLKTGDLSDFTIEASCGRSFPVHKAVLAGRSEYFRAMFRNASAKESTEKKVVFNDISGEVLDVIISHIYSPEYTEHLLLNSELNIELVLAADRFMIDSLKNEVVKLLLKDVDAFNILTRLELADMMQCDELFKKLLVFFVGKKVECLKTQEWIDLRKKNSRLAARILEEACVQFEESSTSSRFARQFDENQHHTLAPHANANPNAPQPQ